jgi:predicted DNA-binding protein (UPF0251 family)/predicted Fe-Mo cluster-binding NifX family protein
LVRPLKCRRVASVPGVTYFKPAGIPMRELEEIRLTVEEAESIRLKDIEDLEQEQCAENMNISRSTFQRILESARRKIADALLNGKAIRIGGGNFETAPCGHGPVSCRGGHTESQPAKENKKKESKMKIAVISDDGTTISQHFGRASLYVVATVEHNQVVSTETRSKMGHQHFAGDHHAEHASGQPHGHDPESQSKHATMAQPISDCKVLIAGGMGMGAYESLKGYGVEPVITDVKNVAEALGLYLQGKLPNLKEKLH